MSDHDKLKTIHSYQAKPSKLKTFRYNVLFCNFQKVDARLKDASVNYEGGKISVRALNYHLNNLQKILSGCLA